jgi:hypothetical protein
MDENIDIEIQELEAEMYSPDFWNNKEKAQEIIKKLKELISLKTIHWRISYMELV